MRIQLDAAGGALLDAATGNVKKVMDLMRGDAGGTPKPPVEPVTVHEQPLPEPDQEPAPPRTFYKIMTKGHVNRRPWPKPGEAPTPWIRHKEGKPSIELVTDPLLFWNRHAEAFEAEVEEGAAIEETETGIRASAVRLVRAVPWSELHVLDGGEHKIEDGVWLAVNGAEVTIEGGILIARDNCKFIAMGKARVACRDTVSGSAHDKSIVAGTENVVVRHFGRSKGFYRGEGVNVIGRDESHITAFFSRMRLRESAHGYSYASNVDAREDSTVHLVGGNSTVHYYDRVKIVQGPFVTDSELHSHTSDATEEAAAHVPEE